MMRKLRVQPIQSDLPEEFDRTEQPKPPPASARSRFVRLIPSVLLRTSSSEKVFPNEGGQLVRDGSGEFEPSSVCLAKMVLNFMEENNNGSGENMEPRCGRGRCNCFNGVDDSSDDEPDCFGGCFGDSNLGSATDTCDILKSLVLCASMVERNLLADSARIVENNKIYKQTVEGCRKFVVDGLVALGYDASICRSSWEKAPSYPAGDYEYIDVICEGERLLVDIDFRSVFEIARPTKTYKTVLQTLPIIFVGKPARLVKIISIMTDAAKQSLKKKGLHFPPWRKEEYVKSKWLAPYTRVVPTLEPPTSPNPDPNPAMLTLDSKCCSPITTANSESTGARGGEQNFDLVFLFPEDDCEVNANTNAAPAPAADTIQVVAREWHPKPPQSATLPKTGSKVVAGLASIMKH